MTSTDSGFWSYQLIDTLNRLGVDWSITVALNKQIRGQIATITDDDWTPISYPDSGEAAVAETTSVTGTGRSQRTLRLVLRRSRLTDPDQAQRWPDWRHHAFITSLDTPTGVADQFHREHATVELAIRDLKEGAGLEHCPSGQLFANAAWLACAVLAHNLVRWTARLGGLHPDAQLAVARTIRTKFVALPGRLVNRSDHHVLRLPAKWPWAATFITALDQIRALPALC